MSSGCVDAEGGTCCQFKASDECTGHVIGLRRVGAAGKVLEYNFKPVRDDSSPWPEKIDPQLLYPALELRFGEAVAQFGEAAPKAGSVVVDQAFVPDGSAHGACPVPPTVPQWFVEGCKPGLAAMRGALASLIMLQPGGPGKQLRHGTLLSIG